METEGSNNFDHASSSRFGVNDARTGSNRDTQLTQRRSGPVQWDVVDKNGAIRATFSDMRHAFDWARLNLRGPQDSGEGDERTGWDVQSIQPGSSR